MLCASFLSSCALRVTFAFDALMPEAQPREAIVKIRIKSPATCVLRVIKIIIKTRSLYSD
jgi:hypothetical protein